MSVRRFGPSDYRAMPWANGRGSTLELAREDADGGLLWRLSMADVVEAGDFSPFPGIDRILTLTEGPGFDLDFGAHGRVAPVEPLVPVGFSGDWATRAENVRGPSRDLNLMTARRRVRADLVVHRGGPFASATADRSLVLALAGDWTVRVGDTPHVVTPRGLLVVAGAGLPIAADGIGVLVVASIGLVAVPTDA